MLLRCHRSFRCRYLWCAMIVTVRDDGSRLIGCKTSQPVEIKPYLGGAARGGLNSLLPGFHENCPLYFIRILVISIVKGYAMMNLKGYEKGEIIHTLAWQRIAFAAMADEKMLRVHWRPSVVQSYNDDVIVHTSLLPDFVIVTECRGKIYGGFFDNMAVNWELTFPTKHEKFWSWERNLRAWLEKTVEMQNQCAHPTAATTNSSILSQTAQLLKAKLEQCSGTIVAIFYVVCVVPSAVSVRLFDSSNFARAFAFSPVFFLLLPYVVEMPADPWVRLETKDRGDLKLDLKTRGMCLVPY
ncbi:hypothetical protein Tco_1255306 [Tanacetum coccineum]